MIFSHFFRDVGSFMECLSISDHASTVEETPALVETHVEDITRGEETFSEE